jgi:hypothetical protein
LRLSLGYPGDLLYAIVLELTVPCMTDIFYQISFSNIITFFFFQNSYVLVTLIIYMLSN